MHVMVRNLDTPDKEELRKLQQLKDELVSEFCFFYFVILDGLTLTGADIPLIVVFYHLRNQHEAVVLLKTKYY